jgi:hypothetical protein
MPYPAAPKLAWIRWMMLALCGFPAAALHGTETRGMAETELCAAAARAAENAAHIPNEFLSAIARVESGRVDAVSGALIAWPWTIDVGGAGRFFASKAEAIAAVRALQASGVRSIDVGCLQVNLAQHPDAFASLEEAFDPDANARYAAGFLNTLFAQTGSWPLAAAAYHSQTASLGSAYQRRVLAEWAVPEGRKLQHAAAGPASGDQAPGAAPPPVLAAGGFGSPIGRSGLRGAVPPAQAPAQIGWPATGRTLAAYRLMPRRPALALPRHPG